MCDLSIKLVAWMDGELPESEGAALERHVESCSDCRECLEAFERASSAFNAYCDVVVERARSFTLAETSHRERSGFQWMPVACGIGVIAAAAVLAALVLQPRHHVAKTSLSVSVQSAPLHAVEQSNGVATTGTTARSVSSAMTTQSHRRPALHGKNSVNVVQQHRASELESHNIAAFGAQPPIEISVPEEDMFPPGAVPDGISYNAVVTFAAEGSLPRNSNANVNGLKTGFNRGGNRP
jgi:anti-sigma factor RsiW